MLERTDSAGLNQRRSKAHTHVYLLPSGEEHEGRRREGDKLRDGPRPVRRAVFLALEACAADKNVKSHRVSELIAELIILCKTNLMRSCDTFCMLENNLLVAVFIYGTGENFSLS
jgi:hypothetical protein